MSHTTLYDHLTAAGWRGRLLLFAGGALTALTMAPFYIWPLVFVGYGVLYVQLVQAPSRRATFWRGWWWGLGFFLAGLYWISIALTVDMVRFGWMIPFALLGLNGFFALFTGLSGLLFKMLYPHPLSLSQGGMRTALSLLYFALALCFGELLRAHLFTGFPWNLIGYSWGAYDITAQAAALIGVYGLTLITPFVAAVPAYYFLAQYSQKKSKSEPGEGSKGNAGARPVCTRVAYYLPAVSALLLCLGLCLYGYHRLPPEAPTQTQQPAALHLRLVQGNITQDLKWDPDHMREALQTLIRLSRGDGYEQADVIIWAETAFPFTLRPDSGWLDQLGGMLQPHQLLVTGAVTAEGEGENLRLWNSIVAINADAQRVARYDKRHLVPFGEFVPLREYLPLEKITPGSIDFSHGKRPPEMPLKQSTARVLVCYEVIFPSYSDGDMPAEWLLNLTNDAWYGHSSGPYQHREMARFRAIEQGMPMVRVANTGITVAYDPYGRTLGHIPLNTQGVIDVALPLPLPESTPYSSINIRNY